MSAFQADFAPAKVRPSPNFGPRLGVDAPDMIILHYTGMVSGQAAEDWLCAPESEVSSHYLVHEDGSIVQMVAEKDRAWHAGRSFWAGETDINSHSVGIEIVNPGHILGYCEFPPVQIAQVISLCRDIATRYNMPASRILAHSDVAPGRKIDPGEKFPWALLNTFGLGHFVEPDAPSQPIDENSPLYRELAHDLAQMLTDYGFQLQGSGADKAQFEVVVAAFQRHFRPARVDGQMDVSTVETLRRLLASLV